MHACMHAIYAFLERTQGQRDCLKNGEKRHFPWKQEHTHTETVSSFHFHNWHNWLFLAHAYTTNTAQLFTHIHDETLIVCSTYLLVFICLHLTNFGWRCKATSWMDGG